MNKKIILIKVRIENNFPGIFNLLILLNELKLTINKILKLFNDTIKYFFFIVKLIFIIVKLIFFNCLNFFFYEKLHKLIYKLID